MVLLSEIFSKKTSPQLSKGVSSLSCRVYVSIWGGGLISDHGDSGGLSSPVLGLWESLWVTCHWLSSDPLGELCLLLQVYCKRFVSQALPFVLCVLGAQVADWAIWGTSPSFIVAPPDVSRPWSALEPWILTSWNGEEPVSLKMLSFSMPEMEPPGEEPFLEDTLLSIHPAFDEQIQGGRVGEGTGGPF